MLRQEAVLEQAPPPSPADDHLGDVVKALVGGRLVIVLGAGVNGRARGHDLVGARRRARPRQRYAAHLATVASTARPSTRRDLAQVARVRRADEGRRPALRRAARASSPATTRRARSTARSRSWPALLRERRRAAPADRHDELRPGARAGVPRRRRGARRRLVRRGRPEPRQVPPPAAPTATATVVEVPNAYADLSLERRTVILKIHGGIDRAPGARVGELRRQRGRLHRTTSRRPRSRSSCR